MCRENVLKPYNLYELNDVYDFKTFLNFSFVFSFLFKNFLPCKIWNVIYT